MDTSQILLIFFGGLVPLAAVAFVLGRRKALIADARGTRLHSLPGQYGVYVATWMALPAIAIGFVTGTAYLFGLRVPAAPFILSFALVGSAIGCAMALRRVEPTLRARNSIEKFVYWALFAASLVSILTTLGIILSIVFEALKFFNQVSVWDFVTGTQWSPVATFRPGQNAASSQFGSVPLFAGTFMITSIAMLVAIPVGLLSAIYMSEYASYRVRTIAKPLLEILAGIPTVVYGFFAAITVSPLVVQVAATFGLQASYTNALAPGLVMGIMIIPFISSLSDDVINSIPNSLREGSYALGMTRSETIKRIVLPAAFPGIMAASLLGVSRALGETMIVVMAAGLRPNLTWNPLEDMTTVTVRIVDALTGDQSFDSPETLAAFALGLVLFVVTLVLNLVSIIVIRKFRQSYE
ncbi:phosphate ABC transporter permease subunit PstC [Salinisphaera aquimarina]|uniref:Phosphate transport system permease protein n=1 Tax=Salinisphaera aquimarina TaxID=2094031 RepID=A0ABV7ES57_9GAMM